jgi:hypothetical protein
MIKDAIENLLFPVIVAAVTYLLVTKLDEWKKRRSYSKLGVAILDSLIEEVRNGKEVISDAQSPIALVPSPLPKQSWSGMNTIPDEVLLRIIEVSQRIIPNSFPPQEIRIHCKNYFEHMAVNWENDVLKRDNGANWRANAKVYSGYIPMTQKVLDMLYQTKRLLKNNSERWIPK